MWIWDKSDLIQGFWKAEMQDALFRAWHCRACKSKLLHRRALRPFKEACFQDGPALVCELNDEAGSGARLQGSLLLMIAHDCSVYVNLNKFNDVQ